jgi:hypothetical protein
MGSGPLVRHSGKQIRSIEHLIRNEELLGRTSLLN